MMTILLPIKAEWVYKIITGIKTAELRKGFPQAPKPFKVLIYVSKGAPYLQVRGTDIKQYYLEEKDILGGHGCGLYQRLNGLIVGEFICDGYNMAFPSEITEDFLKPTCVSLEEAKKYAKDKPLYAWHITDLKVYDNPKTIDEYVCLTTGKPLAATPQNYAFVTENNKGEM